MNVIPQDSRRKARLTAALLLAATVLAAAVRAAAPAVATLPLADPMAWPALTQTAKPWAYWWWMASAVETNNLAKELARYRDAGMGGVHIIPIYGAKGWEDNYIPYLTPQWMAMLAFTVAEANRLGLGVDMTTGSGWCFGGPHVTDAQANASVVGRTFELAAGAKLAQKLDPKTTQVVMAFGSDGQREDLTAKLRPDGTLDYTAGAVGSVLYAISQRPSGQKVKRASPGGEGPMLNLIYPQAMTNYLHWFDDAFANYAGPKPRAQYHDSYEYRSDWSPDFFAQFERRRGYRLQDELPALFGKGDPDRSARVKCDYRETISDVLAEVTLPLWTQWSHDHGFLTRNQAHGSPGNWLDLYAAADIPETEMFHLDRNKLISKFASSAAHVTGKNLVAAETGTWLEEHFTETLADMKYLLDDLFLSGVNHVFYHGTCYSPDEAPWPGWLFYASYEMNPRNSVWRDVPALNAYAARCQAVLQSGKPDNDILLYWPIHDFWHNTNGLARNMSVHARDWFEDQPIGRTAKALWERGYAFDYVSDAQLKTAKVEGGKIQMPGGKYQVVVVPECKFMPLETLQGLAALTENGATVVFATGTLYYNHLPDVSGKADLEARRVRFAKLLERMTPTYGQAGWGQASIGTGRVIMGDWVVALHVANVSAETMTGAGLSFVRRSFDGGWNYFVANRSKTNFNGSITLGRSARSAAVLDPLTGGSGVAALNKPAQVHLQLQAGASAILRAFADKRVDGLVWSYWRTNGEPVEIAGPWSVKFIAGGPMLPPDLQAAKLASWTTFPDPNAAAFAGTAKYEIAFAAPNPAGKTFEINLGDVRQSARVKLNGRDFGTLITPPFRVVVDHLKPTGNQLEVEVTSVSANRIRDLDRRGVKWKNFRDINFVNLDYKPFTAANWPLADCGLLGPVTLTPLTAGKPTN